MLALKLRAYSVITPVYEIPNPVVYFDQSNNEYVCIAYDENQNEVKLPLEMYIGTSDKNGVELFSGDIIEWYDGGVRFVEAIHYSDISCSFETDLACIGYMEGIAKIGNIYQNINLIEGEQEC